MHIQLVEGGFHFGRQKEIQQIQFLLLNEKQKSNQYNLHLTVLISNDTQLH